MNYEQFANKYGKFFVVTSEKTPINAAALLSISYVLTLPRQQILKHNNFFSIARNNRFNQYSTPFGGIEAGINLILNNPNFHKLKVGTLKANPVKQFEKLKQVLDIV